MDIRDLNYLYDNQIEEERKKRLLNILDMADAVYMGMVGINAKNGNTIYNRWHKRIEDQIYPEDKQIKADNFWNRLKKSKRLN
jgi:hypothetical protein